MSNTHINQKTLAATAFLAENLTACCIDLMSYWRTERLSEGKLSELAALCKDLADDPFKFAEELVLGASLKNTAKEGLEAVVNSVHEYECIVPWLNGEPLINSVGTSESECHANLALVDLSDNDLESITLGVPL